MSSLLYLFGFSKYYTRNWSFFLREFFTFIRGDACTWWLYVRDAIRESAGWGRERVFGRFGGRHSDIRFPDFRVGGWHFQWASSCTGWRKQLERWVLLLRQSRLRPERGLEFHACEWVLRMGHAHGRCTSWAANLSASGQSWIAGSRRGARQWKDFPTSDRYQSGRL